MIHFENDIPPGLSRVVQLMVRVKTALVVIALPLLPITFFGVVFCRYILERDLFAYEEWLLPICFWLFFLGSALGTYHGRQINADLLDTVSDNPTFQWLRKLLVIVIEFGITAVVLYWGWLMLADEFANYPNWKTTIALKIPFFVPRLGIVIGLLFMTIYSALAIYLMLKAGPDRYVEAMKRAREEHDEEGETVSW